MAETSLILTTTTEKIKSRKLLQFSTISIIDTIFAKKSFLYGKLPSQPFRLSVLKLDGSSFDIQVSKTASIAELKDAVEAVFSHMPEKGPAKISWPHVWGQFCLCYDGQKLVTEEDYLRNYGIKDGDELHFMRHVSNNCTVRRKRPKKRVLRLKKRRRSRSSQVNSCEPEENCNDGEVSSDGEEDQENVKTKHCIGEEEEEEHVGKNKLTGIVGELFSCTPLAVVRKAKSKSRSWSSTIPRCLLGSFRKIRRIVCFGRRRYYSMRLTWSE
uniref:Ubiquitin-like domain-containing protein n=1 Tax=Lotus japonicus TaxID=34305 RepID=I3T5J9_LOTJA|nr:unknown [Lotus japonicus]